MTMNRDPAAALFTAEELRRFVSTCRYPRDEGWTHAQIARQLKLSAGFIGMVFSGAREPSKAFLNAVGFEKVTMYRMKSKVLQRSAQGK